MKGGLGSWRIGSVNVSTMKRKEGEVVDRAARRHLDFCCLQETGWKGEQESWASANFSGWAAQGEFMG